MKTFSEYRYFTEAVDLVETDQDEWIVELADVNDDDIIEVIDEDGEVIDELEIIEKMDRLKDISRAVSRYSTAKQAQYRAVGGGNRKDKGMKAFKAQIKGRAKSAANVATLGFGSSFLVKTLITFDVSFPEILITATPETPGPVDKA